MPEAHGRARSFRRATTERGLSIRKLQIPPQMEGRVLPRAQALGGQVLGLSAGCQSRVGGQQAFAIDIGEANSTVGQYRIRELGLIDDSVEPERLHHCPNNLADNPFPYVIFDCCIAIERRSIQHLPFPGIRIGIPDPGGIGDNPAVEPEMGGSHTLVFAPLRRLVLFLVRIDFERRKPIRSVVLALSKVPVLLPGEIDEDLSFGDILDCRRARRRGFC